MADKAQLMERGKTYYGATAAGDLAAIADNPNIEGLHRIFNNIDPGTTVVRRDGGEVEMIAVRNVSTISLKPKRLVKWLITKVGSQVDGYTNVDAERAAGVIDERLPAAGCRDDDICWIAIKGRHLVDTAHVTETGLVTMTAGDRLVTLVHAASNNATRGGAPNGQFIDSQSTTLGDNLRNVIGVCLTTKTAGNTNQDMLVDLNVA